ncbi:MAG: 3-isopropylmalate dehydratase small subunit [Pseudomonadota bacterium]
MAFPPVTVVSGRAIPLLADNIDTDVIIRIERLTDVPRADLGRHVFEALRYDGNGKAVDDHVLNDPHLANAPILLAGRNFGCGSSREGAVWALQARGIRAVIAESFGSIFVANCFQNGLLPIALERAEIASLSDVAQRGPEASLEIELAAQRINGPDGLDIAFDINPLRRQCLLDGITDVELTARFSDQIASVKAQDRSARPWLYRATAAPDG